MPSSKEQVLIQLKAQDDASVDILKASHNLERMQRQMNSLSKTMKTGGQQSRTYGNAQQQISGGSKKLNSNLRLVRGGFGQLGHQVQDVAVQLQGGQNAMIVFGQQGSQIASLMGPSGAVYGAILAVGAALATSLLPNLFDSTNHVEELTEALEELEASFSMAGIGIADYSDDLRDLARVDPGAALLQLEAHAAIATEGLDSVRASLSEVMQEKVAQGGWYRTFSDLVAASERLEKAGFNIGTVFTSTQAQLDAAKWTSNFPSLVEGAFELIQRTRDHLMEEFSLDDQEAKRFLETYTAFVKDDSIPAFEAFANVVEELGVAGNEEMAKFGLELHETTRKAGILTAQLAAANAGIKDMTVVTAETTEEKEKREREEKRAADRERREAERARRQEERLQKELDSVLKTWMSEDELFALHQDRQLEILNDALARDLGFREKHTEAVKQLARDETQFKVGQYAEMFGNLSSAMEKGSSAQKKFAAASQAISVAMTVMKGIEAIQSAWASAPFPKNIPIVAFTTAQTLANVAAARAVSFEGGGWTGSGPRAGGLDSKGGYMALVHPRERIIDTTKGGAGVVINNTIDARGADAGVETRIRLAVEQSSAATVAKIQDLTRRGRFA